MTLFNKIMAMQGYTEKEYIALLPLDENGQNEDGEVYLYRYTVENGSPKLENI